MGRHPVVAIDGPSGSGKTTSAREVARRLGFQYVDSGALYRAVALAASEAGINSAEDPGLDALLADLLVRGEPRGSAFRVYLGTREVTESLREPSVTALASRLAVDARVRACVGRCVRGLAGAERAWWRDAT